MTLETPQTTSHPVDPPDPVILSKSPDSSSTPSSPTPSEYALLLDSQALGESILKRHLADLDSRPEPPTTDAVTCAILALRRTTNNRRMLTLMINPNAFARAPRASSHTQGDDPSPHETPRAWRHTKAFYPDSRNFDPDSVAPAPSPVISSSEFRNPESDNCDSPRTLTYSREISRYVAARIVASIKSKPEDAADCCPDLYEEMNLMKSNPAYHAETLAEFYSSDSAPTNSSSENSVISVAPCENSSDPVDPPNPGILSKNSVSEKSVISVAPRAISSDPVDPPNPDILSKNTSPPDSGLPPDVASDVAAVLFQGQEGRFAPKSTTLSRAGPDDP